MYRNLPNLLTILRLVVVPFVVYAIVSTRFQIAALLIFSAGLTDALDGFLARHYRWTSRTGAYLDPVADKLLLVASYVALGVQGAIPLWLMWLVLGRDCLILAMVATAFLLTTIRDFPPSLWGKLSTIVQVFTAFAIIAARAYNPVERWSWEPLLFLITAAITIGSGLHYVWIANVTYARRS